MDAMLETAGEGEETESDAGPSGAVRAPHWPVRLPSAMAGALWRGSELGSALAPVLTSGFGELDAELPGGGWPCRALTEVLQPQDSVAEWRLLAPAMRVVVAARKEVVLVGPPNVPHLPGLRHLGLGEQHLTWIRAETPSDRLWSTEQLVRGGTAGLVLAWLPQARPQQLRRLQIATQSCTGPVFVCRPAAAGLEASPAPLRVQLRVGIDWELWLRLLKRKGAPHEQDLRLPSVPGGLEPFITRRLCRPSRLAASSAFRACDGLPPKRRPHAVGGTAVGSSAVRAAAAQ